MTQMIDARGLPCPQPVILARNAMREADQVDMLLSGADQVANVRRLAERAGWQVAAERTEDGFALHLSRGQVVQEPEVTPDLAVCAVSDTGSSVVVVASDQMGRGEPELGGVLIRAFFHTLTEIRPPPKTIIFYNTGVKLVVQGSPVVEDLQSLEGKGVEILVCGTCLGYYSLKEKVAVGAISNMYSIAETVLTADHVFSP